LLVDGVGLDARGLVARPAGPIDTVAPTLAAVGLRACGPVIVAGKVVVGTRVAGVDRVLAIDEADAADDKRSRRKPDGSGGEDARTDERVVDEANDLLDKPSLFSAVILEVVLGIPFRTPGAKRVVLAGGDVEEVTSRSSTGTSISDYQQCPVSELTIADLL
jgi:hypothetical protein